MASNYIGKFEICTSANSATSNGLINPPKSAFNHPINNIFGELFSLNLGTHSNAKTTDATTSKGRNLPKYEHSSINNLEEMVTCPVHLGLMEDPRLLPCGHAFCLDCVMKCVQSSGPGHSFSCPVCRQTCNICPSGVHQLQKSVNLRNLAHYIVEKKGRSISPNHNDDPNDNFEDSIKFDADQLFSYLKSHNKDGDCPDDYVALNTVRDFFSYLNSSSNQTSTGRQSSSKNTLISCRSASSLCTVQTMAEACNSKYEYMDAETIRETMKKFADYKIHKVLSTATAVFKRSNSVSASNNLDGAIISADIVVHDHDDKLVWITEGTKQIRYKALTQNALPSSFKIALENGILQPHFLKGMSTNKLLIGGVTSKNERSKLVFVLCNLQGKVLKKSSSYPIDDNYVDSLAKEQFYSPCISSFVVDKHGNILIAVPSLNRIIVLSELLKNSHEGYLFDNPRLHPAYLAHNSENNEIWVSCPTDGRIVIIDMQTGAYHQLGTNQINGAIPGSIIQTEDNRVIFLDVHQNRIFWIRKRNEFILIQRLNFNLKQSNLVNAIQTVSDNRVLISNSSRIYLAKPCRSMNSPKNGNGICAIL